MSFLTAQYPGFELIEAETELILNVKGYRSLTPLQTGNSVPQFTFANNFNSWQQFFNGAETHNHIPIRQILSKPLVIAFYAQQWGRAGTDFLKQLNAINPEIRANGGNLVVVTQVSNPELQKAAWDNNLTINFYIDADHQLAKQFGIYHQNSPVWERFSGIDAHVPLLAAFVTTPYHQIIFDHTNWDMDKPFLADALLDEVYQSSLSINTRKSA